jgi:hypothetical protein
MLMTRPTARSADTICTLWELGATNEYGEPTGVTVEYAVKAQVRDNPSIQRKFTSPDGNEYTPKKVFVYELKDIDGNSIEPPIPDKTYIAVGNYVGIDKPDSGINKVVNFDAPTTGVLRGQIPDVMVIV